MRISLVLVLLLIALFVIASAQEDHVEVEDVTNTAADSAAPAIDEDDESDEYEAPKLEDTSKVVFIETFQQDPKTTGWVESKQSKYATQEWKWGVAPGAVSGLKGDKGLIVGREAQHYGISVPVQIDNTNKDLVIQYEVKFEKSLSCGGAYIKLLKAEESLNLDTMDDKSPYVIMFGPDHCAPTDKVHFIFRHQNQKTGEWEEKHLKNPPLIKNDALSHLYTLIVRTDNSFEILIDGESARKGSLLEDFTPSVNPPKEIDDPTDKKPADWVDNEYMDDPEAVKPEDWDENEPQEIEDPEDTKPEDWLDNEPLKIEDPEAKMPAEWDEEEDGKWEAPIIDNPVCKQKNNCGTWKPRMIKNPKYKGKWKAPLIKNPAYKGVWSPRKIANPAFFEDKHPHNFPKIGALAIEIWTMQKNVLFDNFLIAYDENVARQFAKKTFNIKVEKQKLQLPKPAENEKPDFNAMLEQAKEYVMQYSLPLIGTTIALLVVVPFLCCRSSSNKVSTNAAEADSTETEEEESKKAESPVETKEETAQTESASSTSSGSQENSLKKRKKTPKE